MLENLGGKNPSNMSGDNENLIYFLDSDDDEILYEDISNYYSIFIRWAGEELKLPGQNSKTKFKVGDKVRIIDSEKYKKVYIVQNIKKLNVYVYYLEGIDELFTANQLQSANTLKEFDPVMVIVVQTSVWIPALYHKDNLCYTRVNKNRKLHDMCEYIVPLSDFDFHDLESNIKKSIV